MKKTILLLLSILLLFSACAAPSAPPETPEETAAEAPETAAAAETAGDEGPRCSLVIRCDTLLDHMDELTRGKEALVPADGLLLEVEDVPFEEGDSVFDVLRRELQDRHMHLEFSENPIYGSVYVEGICNLYELDCGDLSGWIYRVNGEAPGYGCAKYTLSDGDRVEWLYTCDLGNDL